MEVKILFNGDPIWDYIDVEGSLRTSCWKWIGAYNGLKPVCEIDGRRLSAARYIWDLFCSPKLKSDDHLTYCQAGNRSCVSPLHRHYYRDDLEHLERFILRSSDPDACTGWSGSLSHNGYPLILIGGVTRRANRVLYEQLHGPIPPGKLILHRCNARSCLNDLHLYCGSAQDNTNDMVRCGRAPWQRKGSITKGSYICT